MSDKDTPDPEAPDPRKPYTTPQLVEYGPVEKLTRTGTTGTGDAAHRMMPCL